MRYGIVTSYLGTSRTGTKHGHKLKQLCLESMKYFFSTRLATAVRTAIIRVPPFLSPHNPDRHTDRNIDVKLLAHQLSWLSFPRHSVPQDASLISSHYFRTPNRQSLVIERRGWTAVCRSAMHVFTVRLSQSHREPDALQGAVVKAGTEANVKGKRGINLPRGSPRSTPEARSRSPWQPFQRRIAGYSRARQ